MNCPNCNRDNRPDAHFCDACGALLTRATALAPEGECTVILSFDVDGASAMISQNPKVAQRPSTRSMGEYGPAVGAPKILALLASHDIPASFYIPGWVAERHPDLVRRIAAAGHEVGHHGYLHEPPASLSPDAEAAVLDRASAILEPLAGAAPRGYRSPAWELSEHTLDLLRARDFLYDSSLMGDDRPYALDGGLVEIPVHWSLDDYPYFNFSALDVRRLTASPAHVFDAWAAAFEELHERRGLFVLTTHPSIIGRPGRLRMLDRLIHHMRTFPNVRFARAIDAALEFQQS